MAAKEKSDESLDFLSKESHPVGTGVGTAGGLAGRGVAEMANPEPTDEQHDREDAYWREAHSSEPYYNPDRSYEDYAPAYRMGWESRAKYEGGTFDQYEPAFRNDWDTARGESRLDWDEARHAVKAGWHRIERALQGDADGDGR